MKPLALLWLLVPALALAQPVDIPVRANVSWELPTTATDGQPLTGVLALTELRLFSSTAPIPDDAAPVPVRILVPPIATSAVLDLSAPNGATIYFRAKACNLGGCSVFSGQASKPVTVPVPGEPAVIDVVITVTVGP